MRDTNIELLVEECPELSALDLPLPAPTPPAVSGRNKDRDRVPLAAARRQEPTTLHDAAALTNADAVAVAVEEGRCKARLFSTPPATTVPTIRVMVKAVPLRRTSLRPVSPSLEASSPRV